MIRFIKNSVSVTGSAGEVRNLLVACQGKTGEFDFSSFDQVPLNVRPDARLAWCEKNWGCPSEALDPDDWDISVDGTSAEIRFDTALNPPVEFLRKVSKRFNVVITAAYLTDCGRFAGWIDVAAGRVFNSKDFDWETDVPKELRSRYQLGFVEYWPFPPLEWRPVPFDQPGGD